jgi:ABC-2 type transport system ATP-binding protein
VRAIELSGVGKRYWQLHEQAMLLKSVIPGVRPRRTERWAVRDVDLEVDEGETIGILGRNGAGKTTLLRLLAGVSRPTEGLVRITGRVAPLIGIGVGFHLEMSGRENVLVNGMLLGLSRREVTSRFDEIVEFSELSEFIDTPVKFYSSGMFLRLGFAVAVHVRPRILLVDEILAVGDLGFQRKCFDRMRHLQADGATIVIVSHSMHAIRLLCPRAVLLQEGRLEMDGTAEQVIARHHEILSVGGDRGAEGPSEAPIDVVARELLSPEGPTHHPEPGQLLSYRASLRFNRPVDSPQFFFRVTTEDGSIAYQVETAINRSWGLVAAGEMLEVEVPFVARLGGGTYSVGLIVSDRRAKEALMSDQMGLSMYVAHRRGSIGTADLEGRIVVRGEELSGREDFLITARREDEEGGS